MPLFSRFCLSVHLGNRGTCRRTLRWLLGTYAGTYRPRA